jgi:hypothetical protein
MNKLAYQSGCAAAMAAFKLAEWNWELTAHPKKKDTISSDNGRRAYGTNFSEPGRPSRSVSKAFDALSTTRPSDLLNDAGQASIGSGTGIGIGA